MLPNLLARIGGQFIWMIWWLWLISTVYYNLCIGVLNTVLYVSYVLFITKLCMTILCKSFFFWTEKDCLSYTMLINRGEFDCLPVHLFPVIVHLTHLIWHWRILLTGRQWREESEHSWYDTICECLLLTHFLTC